MKNFPILAATILFVVALALLTGVEANPTQAIYAVPMLAVSCALFRRVERESIRRENENLKASHYKEAA